jgi:uncharacterized membrane protein YjjP (DUF1212 family)
VATEPDGDLRALQTFVVQLGAAMNAAGEPVNAVQQRLVRVAAAYGVRSARIGVFPTSLMVSMGRGEPATLELTMTLATVPRLDQIAALDRLVLDAESGGVTPQDGIRRLDELRTLAHRFGPVQSVLGYVVLTVGLCLLLRPAPREVAIAAVFGAVVGVLRPLGQGRTTLRVVMPVLAAFAVSSLGALCLRIGLADAVFSATVASLIVFLPGAALTTSVLELAAGEMVSGSSRLVSGAMQLALLSFGILAGIELVGVPVARVLRGSSQPVGGWAPWLGVMVFAVGVTVANSAPRRSFPGLAVVLYAAWAGQVLGNRIFGGYVSAMVGAVVLTVVAAWVARLPWSMPPLASFLPGFWLLVPGALGLIGLTSYAQNPTPIGSKDLVATVVSIFAIAVGVLFGTLLLSGLDATGRAAGSVSERLVGRKVLPGWLSRRSEGRGGFD